MTYSQTAAHKASTDPSADFDAIIIGAGQAGLSLADRLTAAGSTSYTMNANGNLIGRGTDTYGYDQAQPADERDRQRNDQCVHL